MVTGALVSLPSACWTPSGDLGGVEESGGPSDDSDDFGDTTGPGLGGSEEGLPTDGMGADVCGALGLDFDVGPSGPRLLTRAQYANTVRDLVGLSEGPWTDPSLEPWTVTTRVGLFDAMVPSPEVEASYQVLATQVAQAIEPEALLPCAVDTPDPMSCAETFVTQLGRMAWRRPLTPDETNALLAYYGGQDLVEGTRAVVGALLSMPEFYRLREQGTPSAEDAGILVLDDDSLATRLSYFLWNSTPDATLLDRAEAGELSDPTALAEEATRMLADPKAAQMVGEMYVQWMDTRGLDALVKNAPEFDAALGSAMETELRLLAADIVLGPGDGRLASLLQSPYTYVNSGLNALYGADVLSTDDPPGATTFVRAQLDPDRRGGLLSLPGVMARYADAGQVGLSRRGMMVYGSWLGLIFPPPPPGEDTGIPTDVDRYEFINELNEDPSCGACHVLLEEAQVIFDNYDELGRWQTEIDGVPVQNEGSLLAGGSSSVTVAGRAELAEQLLLMREAWQSVAAYHLSFALRRSMVDADACSVERLTTRLEQTDGDLADLMVDLVTNDAFARVRPE